MVFTNLCPLVFLSLSFVYMSSNAAALSLESDVSNKNTQPAAAFPYTISLQSKLLPRNSDGPHGPHRRSRSRSRKALKPIPVPLDDFFLGTDLQWFGNISVGTPPQEITVVFDTGSTTLEFTSTLCTSCPQRKFDHTKSSTFVDGNLTGTISFDTGGGVDPVIDNNYQVTLSAARDTVAIGGHAVPDVDFFLITNQTEAFDIDPYSGIQGLGATAQGLFAGLISQGLPALFGLYLTPKAVGHAELTLGGIDHSKFKGNPIYAPNVPSEEGDHWQLVSPLMFVNGKTTPLLQTNRTILFDSGSSNVLFPTDATNAIYALISPDIQPFATEPGTYGIACAKIPALRAVIDLTFVSANGTPFNLTIPSSELSVGPFKSDPSVCQTLINAFDGQNIVGGSLLKHYYAIFDVGKKRLGFAPSDGAKCWSEN